ncbi:hypothetical protein COE09_31225 [Bacillus thuringiensis]|nr:hypothetical protein COE09_31225 [Bacillus thuringiensis]
MATIEIPLTQGQVAMVDSEDYELISRYKWCANKRKTKWYAVGYVKGTGRKHCKLIYMHRLLTNAPQGVDVDHIDGNGLNNMRKNLRLASRTQNMQNARNIRKGTSRYKGVWFLKRQSRWIAEIKVNKRKIHLGTFGNESEAAMAYDTAAIQYFGEFAHTNFNQGGTKMIARSLVGTADITEKEWLKWRKAGIGGSDIGAIAGMSKFKSSIGVYLDKIGVVLNEGNTSEAAYWGTVMEDVIAREFVKRTKMKIRRRNAILRHPEYEWALANVDRIIVNLERGNGILEIKTASEYVKTEWEGDEIPEQYLVQIQWYFFVTGLQWGCFAALVGGNKFIIKEIERDDELIRYLVDIAKDFWLNHVEKDEPPMFDGSEASTQLLKQLYSESIEDSSIRLGKQEELLIEAREQVEREISVLKEQKAEYENKLKAKLGSHEKGTTENYIIHWKSYTSNRFDSKRFKTDHPDLYKEYAKETISRKILVK